MPFSRSSTSIAMWLSPYTCTMPLCSPVVGARNLGGQSRDDLVADRAGAGRHFVGIDAFVTVDTEERHLRAGSRLGHLADVDEGHVHADASDDRRALAGDQHFAAIGERARQAFGVPDRQHAD